MGEMYARVRELETQVAALKDLIDKRDRHVAGLLSVLRDVQAELGECRCKEPGSMECTFCVVTMAIEEEPV